MSKKLNKQQQEDFDKIIQMCGETLIKSMKFIEAENFISCDFILEETNEKYKLEIRKIK